MTRTSAPPLPVSVNTGTARPSGIDPRCSLAIMEGSLTYTEIIPRLAQSHGSGYDRPDDRSRPPWSPCRRGRLLMGSSSGRPDERPVHAVEVAAFRLGVTPVTHAQYAPFLENGGADAPPWWSDPAFGAPDQPVVGVTWDDAGAFAEWLGRTHGGLWRLPTEAEWEWAARGGLVQARTAWGDVLPPGEVPDGPLDGPWPVGRGTPNGYGLFDMGTIVHEWCADWYAPYGAPRPSPKRARGARAAAARGAITCAGRRRRRAAACRRLPLRGLRVPRALRVGLSPQHDPGGARAPHRVDHRRDLLVRQTEVRLDLDRPLVPFGQTGAQRDLQRACAGAARFRRTRCRRRA